MTVNCTYRDGSIHDHVIILNESDSNGNQEVVLSNMRITKTSRIETWSEEEYFPNKKVKKS